MSKYNFNKFKTARFYPFCVNPHRGNYTVFDELKHLSIAPEIEDSKVVTPFTARGAIDLAAELNDANNSWSFR